MKDYCSTTHTYTYIYILPFMAQSAWVKNKLTASLQRGKTPTCVQRYDTKQSYSEAPVMQEVWECGVPLYCYRFQVDSVPVL